MFIIRKNKKIQLIMNEKTSTCNLYIGIIYKVVEMIILCEKRIMKS